MIYILSIKKKANWQKIVTIEGDKKVPTRELIGKNKGLRIDGAYVRYEFLVVVRKIGAVLYDQRF